MIKFDRQVSRLAQFLAIARSGSIHAAAKELNMSQPALTKSLRKFESELGVVLFDRTGAGMTLTKYGSVLRRYALDVEATLQHAERDLGELQDGGLGRLRVAAGPVWLSLILPRVAVGLQRYTARPMLSCVPYSAMSAEELRNNEIDVLCSTPEPTLAGDPAFTIKVKARYPMSLFVRQGHPLAQENARSVIKHLGQHQLATITKIKALDVLLRYTAERGAPISAPAVETGSLESLFALVENTDFVGFVAAPVAKTVKAYKCVAIPLTQPEFALAVGIIQRKSIETLGAFRLFEKELDRAVVAAGFRSGER